MITAREDALRARMDENGFSVERDHTGKVLGHEVGSIHGSGLGGYHDPISDGIDLANQVGALNEFGGRQGLGHNESHNGLYGGFHDATSGLLSKPAGYNDVGGLLSPHEASNLITGAANGLGTSMDYAIRNHGRRSLSFNGGDQFGHSGSAVEKFENQLLGSELAANAARADIERERVSESAVRKINAHTRFLRDLQDRAAAGSAEAMDTLKGLANDGDAEAKNIIKDLQYNSNLKLGASAMENLDNFRQRAVGGAETSGGFGHGGIVNGVDGNGNSLTGMDSHGNPTQAEGVTEDGVPLDGAGNVVHNGTIHDAGDAAAQAHAINVATAAGGHGFASGFNGSAGHGISSIAAAAAAAGINNINGIGNLAGVAAGINNLAGVNTLSGGVSPLSPDGFNDITGNIALNAIAHAADTNTSLGNASLAGAIREDAITRTGLDTGIHDAMISGGNSVGDPAISEHLSKIENDAVEEARSSGLINESTPISEIDNLRRNAVQSAIESGRLAAAQTDYLSKEPLTNEITKDAIASAAINDDFLNSSEAVKQTVRNAVASAIHGDGVDTAAIQSAVESVIGHEGSEVARNIAANLQTQVENSVAQSALNNLGSSMSSAELATNKIMNFINEAASKSNDPKVLNKLENLAEHAAEFGEKTAELSQMAHEARDFSGLGGSKSAGRNDAVQMVEGHNADASVQDAIARQEQFAGLAHAAAQWRSEAASRSAARAEHAARDAITATEEAAQARGRLDASLDESGRTAEMMEARLQHDEALAFEQKKIENENYQRQELARRDLERRATLEAASEARMVSNEHSVQAAYNDAVSKAIKEGASLQEAQIMGEHAANAQQILNDQENSAENYRVANFLANESFNDARVLNEQRHTEENENLRMSKLAEAASLKKDALVMNGMSPEMAERVVEHGVAEEEAIERAMADRVNSTNFSTYADSLNNAAVANTIANNIAASNSLAAATAAADAVNAAANHAATAAEHAVSTASEFASQAAAATSAAVNGITPNDLVKNSLVENERQQRSEQVNAMDDSEVQQRARDRDMQKLIDKGHSEESAKVISDVKHGMQVEDIVKSAAEAAIATESKGIERRLDRILNSETLPLSGLKSNNLPLSGIDKIIGLVSEMKKRPVNTQPVINKQEMVELLSSSAKITPEEALSIIEKKEESQKNELAEKVKKENLNEEEVKDERENLEKGLQNEVGLVSALTKGNMMVGEAVKSAELASAENKLDADRLEEILNEAGVPREDVLGIVGDAKEHSEKQLLGKTIENLKNLNDPAQALKKAEDSERERRNEINNTIKQMKDNNATPSQIKKEMESFNDSVGKSESKELRDAIAAEGEIVEQAALQHLGGLQKRADALKKDSEELKSELERAELKGVPQQDLKVLKDAVAKSEEFAHDAQNAVTEEAARMASDNLRSGVLHAEIGRGVDNIKRAVSQVNSLLELRDPEAAERMREKGRFLVPEQEKPDLAMQYELKNKLDNIAKGPLNVSRHETDPGKMEMQNDKEIESVSKNDEMDPEQKKRAIVEKQQHFEEGLALNKIIMDETNLAAKKRKEAEQIDNTRMLLNIIKEGESKAIDNIESQNAIEMLQNKSLIDPSLFRREKEVREVLENAERAIGHELNTKEQISALAEHDRQIEASNQLNKLEEIRENAEKAVGGARTLLQLAEVATNELTTNEKADLANFVHQQKALEMERRRQNEKAEMPITDLERKLLELKIEKEKAIESVKNSILNENEKRMKLREIEREYGRHENMLGRELSPEEYRDAINNRIATIQKWSQSPEKLNSEEKTIIDGVFKNIARKHEIEGESSLSPIELEIFKKFNSERPLQGTEAEKIVDKDLEQLISNAVKARILPFKTGITTEDSNEILSAIAAHETGKLRNLENELEKRQLEYDTTFEEKVRERIPNITEQEVNALKMKAMEKGLTQEQAIEILAESSPARKAAAEKLAHDAEMILEEKKEKDLINLSIQEQLKQKEGNLINQVDELEKDIEELKKKEKEIKAENEFEEKTKPLNFDDLKILQKITDDVESVELKNAKLQFPLQTFSTEKPQDAIEVKALKANEERAEKLGNAITSENVPSIFNKIQNDTGYYHVPYNANSLKIEDGTAIFSEDAYNDMKKKNADVSELQHKVNTGEISEVPFGTGYWVAPVDGMEMQLPSPLNKNPAQMLTGKDKNLDISKAIGLHMGKAKVDLLPTKKYKENLIARLKTPLKRPMLKSDASKEEIEMDEKAKEDAVKVRKLQTKDGTTAIIEPPIGVEQVVDGRSPLILGKGTISTKDQGQEGVGEAVSSSEKEEGTSLNTLQQGNQKRVGDERIVQAGLEMDKGRNIVSNENAFNNQSSGNKKKLVDELKSEGVKTGDMTEMSEISEAVANNEEKNSKGEIANKVFGSGESKKGKVKFESGFKTVVAAKRFKRGGGRIRNEKVDQVIDQIKNSSAGGSCGGGNQMRELACVMFENRKIIANAMGMSDSEFNSFFKAIPPSVKKVFLRYKDEVSNRNQGAKRRFMGEYNREYMKLAQLVGSDLARVFTKIMGGVLEVVHKRGMPIKMRQSGNYANISRSEGFEKVVGNKIKRFDRKGRMINVSRRRPRMRSIRRIVVKRLPFNNGRMQTNREILVNPPAGGTIVGAGMERNDDGSARIGLRVARNEEGGEWNEEGGEWMENGGEENGLGGVS